MVFFLCQGEFGSGWGLLPPLFCCPAGKRAEKGPHPGGWGPFWCAGSLVQLLVGVVVVLRAELPGQPLFHAAAAHAEVMPAADQQADDRCECQAGADDLQDHACSFVHNTPPVSVHWPSPLGFVSSYTFRRGLTTVFCAGRKGPRPAAPAAGQRIYGAMIRPFYFSGTSYFPCQNPFRLMQDAT